MNQHQPNSARQASDAEFNRTAALADPIYDFLMDQHPALAVNVLVYLCTMVMLNMTYAETDGAKELSPLEGWELMASAIRKSIESAPAHEIKEPVGGPA